MRWVEPAHVRLLTLLSLVQLCNASHPLLHHPCLCSLPKHCLTPLDSSWIKIKLSTLLNTPVTRTDHSGWQGDRVAGWGDHVTNDNTSPTPGPGDTDQWEVRSTPGTTNNNNSDSSALGSDGIFTRKVGHQGPATHAEHILSCLIHWSTALPASLDNTYWTMNCSMNNVMLQKIYKKYLSN